VLVERPGLRDAVRGLLDDRGLRDRLGAAARKKAKREWAADAAAELLITVYSEARATAQTERPNGSRR